MDYFFFFFYSSFVSSPRFMFIFNLLLLLRGIFRFIANNSYNLHTTERFKYLLVLLRYIGMFSREEKNKKIEGKK